MQPDQHTKRRDERLTCGRNGGRRLARLGLGHALRGARLRVHLALGAREAPHRRAVGDADRGGRVVLRGRRAGGCGAGQPRVTGCSWAPLAAGGLPSLTASGWQKVPTAQVVKAQGLGWSSGTHTGLACWKWVWQERSGPAFGHEQAASTRKQHMLVAAAACCQLGPHAQTTPPSPGPAGSGSRRRSARQRRRSGTGRRRRPRGTCGRARTAWWRTG